MGVRVGGGKKIPKIVATFICASSHGQRTHSARTNFYLSHDLEVSRPYVMLWQIHQYFTLNSKYDFCLAQPSSASGGWFTPEQQPHPGKYQNICLGSSNSSWKLILIHLDWFHDFLIKIRQPFVHHMQTLVCDEFSRLKYGIYSVYQNHIRIKL